MPGWLSKVGQLASQATHEIIDDVKERIDQELGSVDIGPALTRVQSTAVDCQSAARTTVEVCTATESKRQEMMAFATEIQATLAKLGQGQDASILTTIQELASGDKVRAASELASGLDTAAMDCVDKATVMIDEMESAIDSLPPILQKVVEQAAASTDHPDDAKLLLADLDRDLDNVGQCINAVEHLNLATGLQVGLQAFTGLSQSTQRSQVLFDTVRDFAADLAGITDALKSLNPQQLAAAAKDLLRCLHLTELMRQIAQGAGKLLKRVIALFAATADRLSALWAALAFAKDCMRDCMAEVTQAKNLCKNAEDRSVKLVNKSLAVKNQLEAAGSVNRQSITAIQCLAKGEDLQAAITLARSMDEFVLKCTSKAKSMVDRVTEGFQKIPPILTEGLELSPSKDNDPVPPDVEADIAELQASRSAIEGSNLLNAVGAGVKGFAGVSSKASTCKGLLSLVEGFATDCGSTIDSFLGSWDLESATGKVREMMRLVDLGSLICQFADQIKRLIAAMMALMKSAVAKFSNLNLGDLGASAGDAVEDVQEAVEDAVEGAVDLVKDKLKFWK